MKTALVLGAGGFIGSHLVKRLKDEGYYVIGVDIKYPEFHDTYANMFFIHDLRNLDGYNKFFSDGIDEVYQLAADMGGAGYLFTGENDANILHNSALINLNVAAACVTYKVRRVFYSSSACVYPLRNQLDPNNPKCTENSVYPADPESEYGWEKLFSERVYKAFARNYGLQVRIARFHNIFGPYSTYDGGKEKAPAALCRKIAKAKDGDTIEVWGDGKQTRSYLYIDECVEGIRRLMESDYEEPLNIGSEEMISVNDFVQMIARIANKKIVIKNIPGPEGVRGRNSDNTLIREKLGWAPSQGLENGIVKTFYWINSKVNTQV